MMKVDINCNGEKVAKLIENMQFDLEIKNIHTQTAK